MDLLSSFSLITTIEKAGTINWKNTVLAARGVDEFHITYFLMISAIFLGSCTNSAIGWSGQWKRIWCIKYGNWQENLLETNVKVWTKLTSTYKSIFEVNPRAIGSMKYILINRDWAGYPSLVLLSNSGNLILHHMIHHVHNVYHWNLDILNQFYRWQLVSENSVLQK